MPNGAAAVVGLELGARAGVITPVSACASGSEAIAHAWRQIVMGDADFAVCGGVEGTIEALPIAAFTMMRPCRLETTIRKLHHAHSIRIVTGLPSAKPAR